MQARPEPTDPSLALVAPSRLHPLARGVAIALTVFALGACSSDDDDDTNGGMTDGMTDGDTMGTDGSPVGDFAVVANDGSSPGSVQFYSPDLASPAMMTAMVQTGANQGIAFGPDGTLYQNSDAEGMSGLFRIADDSSTTQIGSAPGKGLSYLDGPELLASCDVTDETGAASLKLFDPAATAVDAEPVATVDLPVPCWDTFWSADDSRLYAALIDGTLAIMDDVEIDDDDTDDDLAIDRTLTPVDADGAQLSTNFHGVFVEDGTILVSDVGAVTTGANSDGLLFTFDEDGTIDGNVETTAVGGPATMLGNPVDLVLLDGAAIVAEKTNDALLVFEGVSDLEGDVAPSYVQTFTKPESIALAPAGDGVGTDGGTDGDTDGTADGTSDGGADDSGTDS